MGYLDPRILFWGELAELLYEAAEWSVRAAVRRRRRRLARGPKRAYCARRAGPDTGLWNVLAALLRWELRRYGAKAALARHLEIPRQRVTDFISGNLKRLPDAELTLRLLHWLAHRRTVRVLRATAPAGIHPHARSLTALSPIR